MNHTHPDKLASTLAPLWPQPIPVIGLTGDFGSGKSLFTLTVCPGPGTLVYDFEKSTESYVALGFQRVDVYQEIQKAHPNGYTPIQFWEWWLADVRAIRPGDFRVISIDPVSELESALGEWVMAHAGDFGRTRKQYVNQHGQPTGLFWGDLKATWKTALNDLAARCECLTFTAHMSAVYADNKPTSKKKPKGKETLFELASLYLEMQRKPNARGELPARPAAVVRKQRLFHHAIRADGQIDIVPALPPRLPEATPAAIRTYLLKPPDYSRLRPEECAPEEQMSDDDRAELRLRTVEAEAEVERIRSEREERKETAIGKKVQPKPEPVRAGANGKTHTPPVVQRESVVPTPEPIPPAPVPAVVQEPPPDRATDEQLERLRSLRKALFEATGEADMDGAWKRILAKRNVTSARELTQVQITELLHNISSKLDLLAMEAQMQKEEAALIPGHAGEPF